MFDREDYRKNREAHQRGQSVAIVVPPVVTKWTRRDGSEVEVQPSYGGNRASFRKHGAKRRTKHRITNTPYWLEKKAEIAARVGRQIARSQAAAAARRAKQKKA